MSSIRDPYYIYVDSTHRIAGTTSDFKYNMQLPPDHNFTHVVCLDALIPKSFYLIQDGETFELEENGTITKVQLPVGNYFLNVFRTTLITTLNNASPNGWTYNVTYPGSNVPDTGKWTFTVSGNSSQPSIRCDAILYEPLGFERNSINTFVNDTITSTTVINLGSETRLIIHSSLVNNPNVDNVLISINAANSISYSTVAFNAFAPEFRVHKLLNNKSSSESFVLTDEHGRALSLNGLNMNMTLCYFNEDNIYDVLRNFLKLSALQNNSR